MYGILSRGAAATLIYANRHQREKFVLFSWTIILVTRTAVSVVICFGPRRRPSKPFFLNSEVLSEFCQRSECMVTIHAEITGCQ